MASEQYVFESGLKPITLVFCDGSTDHLSIEKSFALQIFENRDISAVNTVCEKYKEVYGGGQVLHIKDAATGVCVAPNKVTMPNNNDVLPQQLEYHAGILEENNAEEHGESTGKVTWSHEAVLLLIELYRLNQDKFSNSAWKSKGIWEFISKGMIGKGHIFNGGECYDKFRGLKYRFKKISETHKRSGESRRTWQYFDLMDNLLAGDPSVVPVKLVSSQESQPTVNVNNISKRFRPITPPSSRTPTPTATTSCVDTSNDIIEEFKPTQSKKRRSTTPDVLNEHLSNLNDKMNQLLENQKKVLENQGKIIEISREKNSLLARLVTHIEKS